MDKISFNKVDGKVEMAPKANKAADPEGDKKLKKACADFEAMMVSQLLKTMRQTIPKGGVIKASQSKETYEMMLDQKVAEDLAHKGKGLGLQEMLYNQLLRQKKEIKVF